MSDLDKQIKLLSKRLKEVSKVKAKRAYSSAVNKTAAKVRTAVTKKISSDVKVAQKNIRKRIFIKRATARKSQGKIIFYSRSINAINIKHVKQRKGYKVAGELYPRSFKARASGNGKHFIWQREGKKRLPIRVIKIDIEASVKRHALPSTKDKMKNEFPIIFKRELKARLKGYV